MCGCNRHCFWILIFLFILVCDIFRLKISLFIHLSSIYNVSSVPPSPAEEAGNRLLRNVPFVLLTRGIRFRLWCSQFILHCCLGVMCSLVSRWFLEDEIGNESDVN